MAAPVDAGRAPTTAGSTAATNKPCVLPASIAAGHRLILVIRSAGVDTHSLPAGWEWLVENNTDDGSNDTTSIMWKVATGSEGASVTVNGTALLKWSAICWRVTGAGTPEVSPIVTGPTTTPNPPAYRPSWGTQEYLWLWVGGWEGEQTSPPAGAPTNYSNAVGSTTGTGGAVATNCRVAGASRALTAIEEDPPSWTISVSDNTSAWTIAIAPATMVGAVPKKRTHTIVSPRARKFRARTKAYPIVRVPSLVPEEVGGATLTPDPVAAGFTTPAPAVVLGAVTLSPSPVAAALSAPAPALSGAIALTPSPVEAQFSAPSPALNGATAITPSPAAASFTSTTPSIVQVTAVRPVQPIIVIGRGRRARPRRRTQPIIRAAGLVPPTGAQTATPTAATGAFSVAAPTVVLGVRTLLPDPVAATFQIGAPTVPGSVAPPRQLRIFVLTNPRGRKDHLRMRRRASAVQVFVTYQEGAAAEGTTTTPNSTAASFVIATPSIVRGPRVLAPTAAPAAFAPSAPTLIRGAVTLAPSPVAAAWSRPSSTIAHVLTVVPSPVAEAWSVPAATIAQPQTVTPGPALGQFFMRSITIPGIDVRGILRRRRRRPSTETRP